MRRYRPPRRKVPVLTSLSRNVRIVKREEVNSLSIPLSESREGDISGGNGTQLTLRWLPLIRSKMFTMLALDTLTPKTYLLFKDAYIQPPPPPPSSLRGPSRLQLWGKWMPQPRWRTCQGMVSRQVSRAFRQRSVDKHRGSALRAGASSCALAGVALAGVAQMFARLLPYTISCDSGHTAACGEIGKTGSCAVAYGALLSAVTSATPTHTRLPREKSLFLTPERDRKIPLVTSIPPDDILVD